MLTIAADADTLLDRGIRVLDLVAEAPGPVPFSALLSRCGFNRATLAKVLKTLCAHGMLAKRPGGYVMGDRPTRYALAGDGAASVPARARPLLESLADRFAVTAQLLRVSDGRSVCLDKVMHPYAPSMRHIGWIVDDSAIQPWVQPDLARAIGDETAAQRRRRFVDRVREAARRTGYVKRVPTRAQLGPVFESACSGVGDDHGLFVPNSRRLAAAIPPAADEPARARDFLLAGMFPADAPRIDRLADAMRDAARAIAPPLAWAAETQA